MASKSDPKPALVRYLKQQNRPYSTNDLTQNLKDFGKTAIQKALDELSSAGKIKEKVYGKQKVYAPLQDDDIEKEAMDLFLLELDTKIASESATLSKIEQELKVVESELKMFCNQVSTEEAAKLLQELDGDVVKLEEKLTSLTKGGVQISDEDKTKITKTNENVQKEYRKRKRICMDIANQILENYPKPKKAFFDEVGIETDEEVSR